MTDLSTLLVKLRKDHGLSQKQVATRLSVSRQTYAAWEKHCPDISLAKFFALQELYQLETVTFLRLIEELMQQQQIKYIGY